jgi:hypothetical protein
LHLVFSHSHILPINTTNNCRHQHWQYLITNQSLLQLLIIEHHQL